MKRTLCSLALLAIATVPALASSHREAPFITEVPKVDGTDFYMFRSYEAGRDGFVTLIANYQPLQDSYGGPNYFALDPDALYRIHIDRTGDGMEELTFQLKVSHQLRDIKLPVGSKMVSVPLTFIGPVDTPGDPNLNAPETYTLQILRGPLNNPTSTQNIRNATTNSARFARPLDNVGTKTIADYAGYAAQFIHPISIPGCSGNGRVFVGQRAESFAVNLGEIFDLVNVANPLGDRDAVPSQIADKNITTIALEVPISCLTGGGNTTVGGWTTAALPASRVLAANPTFLKPENTSGGFVQVSRLGMPLVNEVVIGLKDKNKFNASAPKADGQFADYVTNPTLPEILEILFGAAGVQAPNNFPRTDLIAAFLTGVGGLNQLGGPSEMVRLNTAIAPTPAASQNNLGVLGGDNAGFPNGRRPGDDVVDAALRVSMGVLCHAFPGVFCNPADAPSGNLPFTDQTLQDVSQFDTTFPYLKTPIPGSPHELAGIN
jgi:Domain of unknown function (DUF4331)